MRPGLTTHTFDRRLGAPGYEWSGRLEQVYVHAAVARADGSRPDLILLHPDRDLLPRGIQVPWDSIAPRPGDRLEVSGGRLRVTGSLGQIRQLDLAGAGTDLRVGSLGPGCRLALGHHLAQLGLPARVRVVLGDVEAGTDLAGRECAGLATNLVALLAGLDRASPEEALSSSLVRLVGLGTGSTPAGDDALVGVLAAAGRFSGLGWLPPDPVVAMQTAIGGLPAGATTPAGRAMLEQAAVGCFPLALVRLVRLLANPLAARGAVAAAQEQLMRLGASSGQDMLAGVLATARWVWKQRR